MKSLCLICGANVAPALYYEHIAWHERQTKNFVDLTKAFAMLVETVKIYANSNDFDRSMNELNEQMRKFDE